MVICKLSLLRINKDENQNSLSIFREILSSNFKKNLCNTLDPDASQTDEHGQIWPPGALF
jgi:hypothetical protein